MEELGVTHLAAVVTREGVAVGGCVPSVPHDPQGEAQALPGSDFPPGLSSAAGPGSSEQHRELVLSRRHENITEQGQEEILGLLQRSCQSSPTQAGQSHWMPRANTSFEERRRMQSSAGLPHKLLRWKDVLSMAMFAQDTALEPSLPGWCSTGHATLPPALFCCLVSLQK